VCLWGGQQQCPAHKGSGGQLQHLHVQAGWGPFDPPSCALSACCTCYTTRLVLSLRNSCSTHWFPTTTTTTTTTTTATHPPTPLCPTGMPSRPTQRQPSLTPATQCTSATGHSATSGSSGARWALLVGHPLVDSSQHSTAHLGHALFSASCHNTQGRQRQFAAGRQLLG
jgi:hypothetical protein